MTRWKQVAAIAGVILAIAFPFVPYPRVLPVSQELSSILCKFAVAAVLAAIAFAILKRPLSFYHLRGFAWRDAAAMFAVMIGMYAAVALVSPMVDRVTPPPDFSDAAETPLAMAIAGVLAAGIFEEFIYRGFLIEELGELLPNRGLAAAVAVAAFAFAHSSGPYGWTASLLFPAIAGVALTVLYFWRKSLPLCILLHTIVDALSLFVNRS